MAGMVVMLVRASLVTLVFLAAGGCVETQQHVDPHTLPTTESIQMPAWASTRGNHGAVPPTATTGGQATLEGMPVAAPVTVAPRGSRWQSRILGTTGGDPVDVVLHNHNGDHVIDQMDLADAPVIDTLRNLAQTGGVNLVFSEDIGDRTVTLNLRDMTVTSAFHAVLNAAHLGAETTDQGAIQVVPAPAD